MSSLHLCVRFASMPTTCQSAASLPGGALLRIPVIKHAKGSGKTIHIPQQVDVRLLSTKEEKESSCVMSKGYAGQTQGKDSHKCCRHPTPGKKKDGRNTMHVQNTQ